MSNQKTIKDLMIAEINALRKDKAPEDYQVFNSPEFIMDNMARMWQRWDNYAKTMSLDYHIKYEDSVRICAITEELGLAVNYAENCDTNETMEIIPYLTFLTTAGGELIDMIRTKLPEKHAEQTTAFLQLQSILGSLYKHVLSKCLATRRTLTLLHGGKGLIELAGDESVRLPDASDLMSEEILECYDCEMDCMNCKNDSSACTFGCVKTDEQGMAFIQESLFAESGLENRA